MARRFGSRPNVPRRKRVWARQRCTFAAVTLAAPQQVNLMSGIENIGAGASPLGWTVGPVYLSALQVRRTSATVALNQEVVLGIRVGSEDIEAVDQNPVDRPMLDWMYFQALPPTDGTTTAQQFFHGPEGGMPATMSSRKLEEFHDTLWIVAGANAVAPASFEVSCWASVLCLLP